MSPGRNVWTICIGLALSGCLAADVETGASPPSQIILEEISIHNGFYAVPMDEAQARMSGGFTPAPSAVAYAFTGAAPPGPTADLWVQHILYERLAIDGNDHGPGGFGYVGFFAVAPPDQDTGDAGFPFYPIQIGATEPELREALRLWGADPVAVEMTQNVGAPGRQGTASWATDDPSYTLHTYLPDPPRVEGASHDPAGGDTWRLFLPAGDDVAIIDAIQGPHDYWNMAGRLETSGTISFSMMQPIGWGYQAWGDTAPYDWTLTPGVTP